MLRSLGHSALSESGSVDIDDSPSGNGGFHAAWVCPIGGWFRMQNPSYNG